MFSFLFFPPCCTSKPSDEGCF